MDYVDKDNDLTFFKDDLAYGHALIKKGLFKKGEDYSVAVDGDKMFLLSPAELFSVVGTDGEYYVSSHVLNEYRKYITNGLYSLKNHKLMNVDNKKLIALYECMFLTERAKEFELAFILSEINSVDLEILAENEKKQYYNYLTSGNKMISHNEVVNYILEKIPELQKYTNLGRGLSAFDYRLIVKELGTVKYAIAPIPQDLDFLQYDEEIEPEYREIYLPETIQKQRVLTYRNILKK